MQFHASFRALFALSALVLTMPAQALERSEVPTRYQWDLKDLYVDEAAWVAAKQELVESLPALGAWQGKLGASAGSLLDGMTAWEQASRRDDRQYPNALQQNNKNKNNREICLCVCVCVCVLCCVCAF